MDTKNLRAQLVLHSIKMSDYAKALGISKSALCRRMNGTASFTREEIQKTIQLLNLSEDDAMQIFFAA